MTTKTIPIADATEAQLRVFAETVLGMSIHPNAKRETVIAKVIAAHQGDTITVEADDAAPQAAQVQAPAPILAGKAEADETDTSGDGLVRILIETRDEPGGDKPIPVSVNGRAMLIPRGKEVDVPRKYVEVLTKAVRHVYDPIDGGGISTTPRNVPAYPFRIIQDPAPAARAAA